MAKAKKVKSTTAKTKAAETKKAAKKVEEVVEDDEIEEDDGVVESDDEDEVEEEVVDTTYVADLRAMTLATKSAKSDSAIVKSLAATSDLAERRPLIIQHIKNIQASSENQTLALGEALYEFRQNGYWKEEKDAEGNPYTKMEAFWSDQFGLTPITGYRHVKLYEKLVVELDLPVETIEEISMTVWRNVLDVINEENFEEIKAAITGMTVKDAEAFAKNIKKLGLEEAIEHKDDEDDVLPEGDDVEDGDEDDGDLDDAEEPVKTIKMQVVASTFELFNAMIDAAASVIPEIKGEKKESRNARALNHILMEWNTSCYSDDDRCENPEEYIQLQIAAMEQAFGISIFGDDEDEGDDE